MINLEEIKKVLQEAAVKLDVDLIDVRLKHDSDFGQVVEVIIDKDYQIDLGKIEEYTDYVNPLLDQLDSSDYMLDISSGGSERLIPYADVNKLVDRYLEFTLNSGEKLLAKVASVEVDGIHAFYFIKGRKKNVILKENDISKIHMGYKA